MVCRPQSSMVAHRPCPLLSVEPTRGLVDEKLKIIVRRLGLKQEVTLHSLHHSEDKDLWEAFGHYVSDQHGTVTGNYTPPVFGKSAFCTGSSRGNLLMLLFMCKKDANFKN